MLRFLARRLVHLFVALVLLTGLTFLLVHAAPGGPAQALLGPDQVMPQQQAAIESRLGLTEPLSTQLINWFRSAIVGDFGNSYFYRQSAMEVVFDRLPSTLILGGTAAALAILIGIPAGILAASRPGGFIDHLAKSSAVVLITLPAFWLGILLIFLFSVQLGWMPSSGTGRNAAAISWLPEPAHILLPAATIALPTAATFMLYTRSAMIEVLETDSIRTARGMGLPERRVLSAHAFPQALAPVLMQIGLYLPHLVEGSIVVETVFSWPGIGQLTTASVGRRDYPILLAMTMVLGIGTILASTITDIVHARIDPRVELQ